MPLDTDDLISSVIQHLLKFLVSQVFGQILSIISLFALDTVSLLGSNNVASTFEHFVCIFY